jgi:hypothetical protein
MPKYTVNKIYKYTETVEIEAESEQEAMHIANITTGDKNHDDYLYDCEIVSSDEF